MTSPLSPKQPPALQQDAHARFLITAAFWAVVLFLGLPFWWYSTSIERVSLPTSEIEEWTAKSPCFFKPHVELMVNGMKLGEDLSVADNMVREWKRSPAVECVDLQVSGSNKASTNSYELLLDTEKQGPTVYRGRRAEVNVGGINEDAIAVRAKEAADTLLDFANNNADPRVAKFSSKYKLVFSLLNQDSTAGGALYDWDINDLLRTHLRPLLSSLAPLHSFEIETQIHYFAPLTINLQPSENGTLIEEDELRAFVNSADWKISSPLSQLPVLHFLLYVPSPQNRPMQIRTSTGAISTSNAFISPQWGGVAILSPTSSTPDLSPAFHHFAHHLQTLLGVPQPHSSKGVLEAWQIDAVVRRRLMEVGKETVDTLEAIEKLTREIPNMRVGEEVRGGVRESLALLESAKGALRTSTVQALRHVARASEAAQTAYFNPTMLALLYYPDEHKYAVYTPLHGPVAVPLLVSALREWKAWRERRRKKKEAEEKEKEKEKVE